MGPALTSPKVFHVRNVRILIRVGESDVNQIPHKVKVRRQNGPLRQYSGRVAERGAPAELMERDGLFARMVRLQRESAQWTL